MEVEILQEHLAKALQNISRVATSKAGLPILGNVLFRSDGNRLCLIGTNLEIATTEYINAKIISPGSITVPARLTADFIQNLPKEKLTLAVKNSTMSITSNTNTSKINGINDDEFPEIPQIEEAKSTKIEIGTDSFKEAVSQTIIAASSDPTRQILTGAYLYNDGKELFIAATDGYRLAEKKLSVKTEDQITATIPVSTLQEVLRSLTDSMKEIHIEIDETQVKFTLEDMEIISKLIDGNFPDYRQLLPKTQTTTVTVDKSELVRVIKLSRLFSRETSGGIVIDVDESVMTVKSITSEVGENTSKIPVTHSGEKTSISLNSRYLSDVLGVLDSKEVELSFSTKLAPIQITPVDKNADYKHIIMPIKS